MRGIPDTRRRAGHPHYVVRRAGCLHRRPTGCGAGLRTSTKPAPSADVLLPGAPKLAEWAPDEPWRLTATIVAEPEIYVHDWGDAEAIDRWLYRHYPVWEEAMIGTLGLWLDVAHDWATSHDVPIVFGEGGSATPHATGGSRRGPSAPSSAGSPSTNPSASAPGAPSSAPTPHHTTPCGPTPLCSSNVQREAFRTGTPCRPTS